MNRLSNSTSFPNDSPCGSSQESIQISLNSGYSNRILALSDSINNKRLPRGKYEMESRLSKRSNERKPSVCKLKRNICYADCELQIAKINRDITLLKLQEVEKQLERENAVVEKMISETKQSITIDGVSTRRGSYKNFMQELSKSLYEENWNAS